MRVFSINIVKYFGKLNINNSFKIGEKFIGDRCPVYVIAEIGVNHEGDANTCAEMIVEAAKSGVDAVKLQSFYPDEHYLPDTESYKIYKNSTLSLNDTASLFELAKKNNVDVFTTCGDEKTINFIEKLNPVAYKISSGLVQHYPIIKYLASKKRPLLMSTGMSDMAQVKKTVNVARQAGAEDIALLQCVSLYPVSEDKLNLSCIKTFESEFKLPVGFSDHSLGSYAVEIAVACGAKIIEKHFSLDKSRSGYDHKISMNPDEFAEMIIKVRNVEKMLGNGIKFMTDEEQVSSQKYKRCIVAKNKIYQGQKIKCSDLIIMRVGPEKNGLSPENFEKLDGIIASRDIDKHTVINELDLMNYSNGRSWDD